MLKISVIVIGLVSMVPLFIQANDQNQDFKALIEEAEAKKTLPALDSEERRYQEAIERQRLKEEQEEKEEH